jgi:hypothetical protein
MRATCLDGTRLRVNSEASTLPLGLLLQRRRPALHGSKREATQPQGTPELFGEKAYEEPQGLAIRPLSGSVADLLLRIEHELFGDQLEQQLWWPSWSITENRPEGPRLKSGDEWPSWVTNTCSMSHPVCGTAGHAETSRWAERLGTVGLLQVVATRDAAPLGRTKHLPDVSGQRVNFATLS